MKAQTAPSEEGHPMGPNTKTWGPFTGRQLTTIVCVIAAVVLLPVGSWAAASLSKVVITDPGGTNQAKVDNTGKLEVAATAPALPAKPIIITATDVNGSSTLYGPETKPFGISSLTVSNLCDSMQLFFLAVDTTSGNFTDIQDAQIPAAQTIQLNFPTPLVTTPPHGGTATLIASGSSGCVAVNGVGVQS